MEKQGEERELSTTTVTATANWSEEVEDLVSAGDVSSAISLLESIVSKLESSPPSSREEREQSRFSDLQLASALADLADLYSSHGFSLKSDELRSRSSVVRQRALRDSPPDSSLSRYGKIVAEGLRKDQDSAPSATLSFTEEERVQLSTKLPDAEEARLEASDDDWEAIADCSPNELFPAECLPDVSKISLEDDKLKAPKRRGRGTFTYKTQELYSDRISDDLDFHEEEDEGICHDSEEKPILKPSIYGTHHVLVLADFPPSTRTTELEKLLGAFTHRGVVIRWVNDTTALAVFRTPALALEALGSIQFPFTVRILDEDDSLLSKVSATDLEPPKPRPQTSARAAQRLIAHSMGLKLPTSSFGSRELREQEEARKDRIDRKHKMRDDAWGDN